MPDLLAAVDQRMRDVEVRIHRNESACVRFAGFGGERLEPAPGVVLRLRQEQHLAVRIGHREIGDFRMVGQQVVEIGVHAPQAADRNVEAHRLVEIVGDRPGQNIRLVLDDRLQPLLDGAERNPGKQRIRNDQRRYGDETDAKTEPGKGRGLAAAADHGSFPSATANLAAVSRTDAL